MAKNSLRFKAPSNQGRHLLNVQFIDLGEKLRAWHVRCLHLAAYVLSETWHRVCVEPADAERNRQYASKTRSIQVRSNHPSRGVRLP